MDPTSAATSATESNTTASSNNVDESQSAVRTTTFSDLNEHCLHEIIQRIPRKKGNLRVTDLNSIASTCRQLNKIARDIFVSKQSKDFNVFEQGVGLHLEIIRYLCNFGDLLQTVKFDSMLQHNRDIDRILQSILTNCQAGKLELLCLRGLFWQIPIDTLQRSKPLFEHLKRIEIVSTKIENITNILSMIGNNCVELNIRSCIHSIACYANRFFPKLEKFSYLEHSCRGCRMYNVHVNGSKVLCAFIRRHSHIKSLLVKVDIDTVDAVSSLTNLESMSLDFVHVEPKHFLLRYGSAANIRSLIITHCTLNHELADGLNRFQNLRVLGLFQTLNGAGGVNAMHNFTELRELRLGIDKSWNMSWPDLITIINKMPNLERLTLFDMDKLISDFSFHDLVDIYRKRNKTLEVIWLGDIDLKVPADLIGTDYLNFVDVKRKYKKYFIDKYDMEYHLLQD